MPQWMPEKSLFKKIAEGDKGYLRTVRPAMGGRLGKNAGFMLRHRPGRDKPTKHADRSIHASSCPQIPVFYALLPMNRCQRPPAR